MFFIVRSSANQNCKSLGGQLFTPVSPSSVNEVGNFLSRNSRNLSTEITGLWTGLCQSNSSCKAIHFDRSTNELTFTDVDETTLSDDHKYVGLCSIAKDVADDFPLIYSCQCEQDFGYENCTDTVYDPELSVQPGITLCQSDNHNVELNSGSSTHIIYVDHVAFGKPFYQEKSLSPHQKCPKDYYAKSNEEYCVAGNSLAAVTYWCQGKKSCNFTTDMLLDAPVVPSKDFFVANFGAKMSYIEAVAACHSAGHSLALLR